MQKKIASVLKSKYEHNWPYGEAGEYSGDLNDIYKGVLTEDEIKRFSSMCPYGDYGIHTIESIRVLTISEEEEIF